MKSLGTAITFLVIFDLLNYVIAVSQESEPITIFDAYVECRIISTMICDFDCRKPDNIVISARFFALKKNLRSRIKVRLKKSDEFLLGELCDNANMVFKDLTEFGYKLEEVVKYSAEVFSVFEFLKDTFGLSTSDIIKNLSEFGKTKKEGFISRYIRGFKLLKYPNEKTLFYEPYEK